LCDNFEKVLRVARSQVIAGAKNRNDLRSSIRLKGMQAAIGVNLGATLQTNTAAMAGFKDIIHGSSPKRH
jgi:hypothetical protein